MNIWALRDKLKKLVRDWNVSKAFGPKQREHTLELEGKARLCAFEIYDLITDAGGGRRGLSGMIGRWVSSASSGDAHAWLHDRGAYVGGGSGPSVQEAILALFAPGSATLKALRKHFPSTQKRASAKRKLAKGSRVAGSGVSKRKSAKRPLAKRKK